MILEFWTPVFIDLRQVFLRPGQFMAAEAVASGHTLRCVLFDGIQDEAETTRGDRAFPDKATQSFTPLLLPNASWGSKGGL